MEIKKDNPRGRGRPKKYETEEEKKEAQRDIRNRAAKKWYYNHYDEVIEKDRQRNAEMYAVYKLYKAGKVILVE